MAKNQGAPPPPPPSPPPPERYVKDNGPKRGNVR